MFDFFLDPSETLPDLWLGFPESGLGLPLVGLGFPEVALELPKVELEVPEVELRPVPAVADVLDAAEERGLEIPQPMRAAMLESVRSAHCSGNEVKMIHQALVMENTHLIQFTIPSVVHKLRE
jgi:hypothetical protein